MSEFQPLIDQIYRERIAARAMTPEERMQQGMELIALNFEMARSLGEEEMMRRFRIARQLDEQGCYGPPFPIE